MGRRTAKGKASGRGRARTHKYYTVSKVWYCEHTAARTRTSTTLSSAFLAHSTMPLEVMPACSPQQTGEHQASVQHEASSAAR